MFGASGRNGAKLGESPLFSADMTGSDATMAAGRAGDAGDTGDTGDASDTGYASAPGNAGDASDTGDGSDTGDVGVEECQAVSAELVEAMRRLIPQLSSSNPPPGRLDLEEIVASPATTLFVARRGGRIVGALTLVAFRIPTGVRTRIEDVVVDENARGSRVGERLSAAALAKARQLGARNTDLTSRPSRRAANRLYERMGFQRRESNVYRYTL